MAVAILKHRARARMPERLGVNKDVTPFLTANRGGDKIPRAQLIPMCPLLSHLVAIGLSHYLS